MHAHALGPEPLSDPRPPEAPRWLPRLQPGSPRRADEVAGDPWGRGSQASDAEAAVGIALMDRARRF